MAPIARIAAKLQGETTKKSHIKAFASFIANTAAISSGAVAIVVVVVLFFALASRLISSRPMIVVQPFEEGAEASKACGMTGKNAEDIFVDRLNNIIADATEFHGNMYSNRHSMGALSDLPRVPVATAYGIAFHGISLDDLEHLFDRLRYQQWTVTGDVVLEAKPCHLRIRLGRSQGTSELDITPAEGQSFTSAIEEAAFQITASAHPELAGRAILQEIVSIKNSNGNPEPLYKPGESALRSWCTEQPRDKLPYLYLITMFLYEGKYVEAQRVAEWIDDWPELQDRVSKSENYAWLGANAGSKPQKASGRVASSISIDDKVKVFTATAVLEQGGQDLFVLQSAKARLDRLALKYPGDQQLVTNSAVANQSIVKFLQATSISRELTEDEKGLIRANLKEAVLLLRRAEALDPDNPGTHLNLGRALGRLSKFDGSESPDGLDEILFAVHLAPNFRDAFGAASEVFSESSDRNGLRAFCETVPLMVPFAEGASSSSCPNVDSNGIVAVRDAKGPPIV